MRRDANGNSESTHPLTWLGKKPEEPPRGRGGSHRPPLLASAELGSRRSGQLRRQPEAGGREKNQETGQSIHGAADRISWLAPQQVQRNQHERVTNPQQQVGTEC